MDRVVSDRQLFVLNRADDHAGGTVRAAVNTADALAAAGTRVTVTAPRDRRANDLTIVSASAPAVAVLLFDTARAWARFGCSWRQLWWLIRNIRSFSLVHIHSVFYVAAVYTAAVCRVRGVPFVVWPHGSLDPFDLRKHASAKSAVGPMILRPLLGASSALLCTHPTEADRLVTYGAVTPRRVVPLPVPLPDHDMISPDRKTWRTAAGIGPDDFALLFFGRIDPVKGLPRLVEAVASIGDERVRLVVAGGGDAAESDRVRRLVTDLGLSERVHFTGWLTDGERAAAMSACDAFVLPSDSENFALALVEALAAGLPAIVSDGVNIGADLAAARAALVTRRDPGDIAAAIRQLVDDPAAAAEMSARATDFVRRRYSPEAVAAALGEVTDAIVGRPDPHPVNQSREPR